MGVLKPKPNYILEGPDCTGKSTIANTLGKLHGIPVIHCTYYKERERMVEQFNRVVDILRSGKGVVVDRFIVSNILYGDVYHQGCYVPCHEKYTDPAVLGLAEHIFCFNPDRDDYVKYFKSRYAEREEMYSLNSALNVWNAYDDFLNNPNSTHKALRDSISDLLVYDWRSPDRTPIEIGAFQGSIEALWQ